MNAVRLQKARPSTGRFASDAFTSVETQALVVDGEPAGFALSLGHKLLFFTTDPELATLDGGNFASVAEVRNRVRRLRALSRPPVRAIA